MRKAKVICMLETGGLSFEALSSAGGLEPEPREENDGLLELALRMRYSIWLKSSVINGSKLGLNVFSLEWIVLLSTSDEGSASRSTASPREADIARYSPQTDNIGRSKDSTTDAGSMWPFLSNKEPVLVELLCMRTCPLRKTMDRRKLEVVRTASFGSGTSLCRLGLGPESSILTDMRSTRSFPLLYTSTREAT